MHLNIPILGLGLPLGLALAGCRSSDDGAWTRATPLSSAAEGAAVSIAVSPNAVVTASWVAATARGKDGKLVVRPDLRRADVHEVPDSGGALTIYGETPPKLAYGRDGALYAAYLLTRAEPGRKWPVNVLRFRASRDGGATWTAPTTLRSDTANGGSTDDHSLAVGPDGTVYLTWLAQDHGTSHTYVMHSTDQGMTWSEPTVVDPGASCPCCRTALAPAPDGKLYLAWRKIYRGADGAEVRDIVVASSADRGATWSAPTQVHVDDWRVNYCPDAGPSVRVGANGAVHVAWWTGLPGASGVKYAQSTDGGATFGAPVVLGVAPTSRASHVQLALGGANDSSIIAAVWDDGTKATAPITARISRDGGRSFGSSEILSPPNENGGYPVVALAGDSLYVAWQSRSTEGARSDSLPQQTVAREIDSGRGAVPESERWIKPVGAWTVWLRARAIR